MSTDEARPRVVVVFTGGTISMLRDPETGLASPALGGAELLELTPGLDGIAEIEARDWGRVPASHLRFSQVIEIARLLHSLAERPEVDGIVVVQGTDTIEETAFAFDLLHAADTPIVVVGAMRSAADAGYEGPANLRDAISAAASPDLRGQGAVVVMDGDIWPADDVIKTHSDRYDAFRALNTGPLGRIAGSRVIVTGRRGRRRSLPAIPAAAAEPVALITAVISTDGSLLRAAVRGGTKGVVVAATGSGNTDPDLLVAAQEAMASGIPVVHTTRCAAGRVSATYGFPGGGGTWFAAGAIPAGFLGGPKARVALALGLGAGLDVEALRALFAD